MTTRSICFLALLGTLASPILRGSPQEEAAPVSAAEAAPETSTENTVEAPPKKFVPALAQVLGYNVITWSWNRFVTGKQTSRINFGTWGENLSRGFAYDPDKFVTNQLSHPMAGGLYYTAARANGFDLWESSGFTALGSLTWEYFGETTRPSTNDLISTTLGGISAGETSYRLSELVFDDTSTGFARVLHELAGMAVSPGRALDRLFTGGAWRVGPNPEGRLPAWLDADASAGYLRVRSTRAATPETTSDRATLSFDVRYGDPFEKDLDKPFSSFRLGAELATRGPTFLSRVDSEGILFGRHLDSSGPERTIAMVTFGYTYEQVDLAFGGETLGAGIASRFPLSRGYDLVAKGQALSSFSAVQTSEVFDPSTHRSYDYGLGGGVNAGAALRRGGRDLLEVDYTRLWLATVNGPTESNDVEFARATVRIPLSKSFALGAELLHQRHRNVYSTRTETRTSRQLRAVVSWNMFAGRP